MTRTLRFLFITSLIICTSLYFYTKKHVEVVNIYGWYDLFPQEITKQFEDETGIKVVCDFFDSNDILQTKLLAGRSGYDIVTPTAARYLTKGIALRLFQPLNYDLIPNMVHVDPIILDKLRASDPELTYGIPYGYGTYGIVYNQDIVSRIFPGKTFDSYELLFDPRIAKHLKGVGINIMEEYMDVFPMVLSYLGLDVDQFRKEDLFAAYHQLMKVRPFIKRFSGNRYVNDLMIEEIAVAQSPNHEAHRAILGAKELGINLTFFIPNTERSMWIDTFTIPTGAPHVKNAHAFINFMLRPDIAAQITNLTLLPNSIIGNEALIDPHIYNSDTLILKDKHRYSVHQPKDIKPYEQMTNLFAKVRLGRN